MEISWSGSLISMILNLLGLGFSTSVDSLFGIMMFGTFAVLSSLALLTKTIQDKILEDLE